MKHLSKKLKKGNYGQVLIHIKDGEVTGVTDKIDFNSAAFVDHVARSTTRYVVKNKKTTEEENNKQIADNCNNSEKSVIIVNNPVSTVLEENKEKSKE